MYISPPDCKVINLGVKFNHLKINGKRGIIDLSRQKPYVVLAGQPGMLFGKGNRDVVHAPAALQAGGRPKFDDDSMVDEIMLPPIEQNEQYPLRQLIIILDRSSSMANRLPLVQQQIMDLGPHLSKLHGLKISLVSFDAFGKKEITYVDNFGQIVKRVGELVIGHGTDIANGLKVAKDVLTKSDDFDPNSTDRNLCIFVTDGGHGYDETFDSIFPLTNEIANLGNSIFVVSGVGTAYSPAVNRKMAGVACSGAWSHVATSLSDKALKKLGQSDFFGSFIPKLLRQITGNDNFIRIAANGVDRAWCVEPSVFENELSSGPKDSPIHQLGPSIWTYPSYVCFAKDNESEPEFTVTAQERITPDTDNEQTQPVEMVNFDDLIDPELRLRTIFAMRKFFLSLCLQQEAPEFLAGLRNIGLIRRDQFQRYAELLARAALGGEGAKEELYEESSSTGNESLGSFGGMEAELERMLGEGSEGAGGYELSRALADLEKKLGGAGNAAPDLENPQGGGDQLRRTQAGGGFEGHSGGLGGLDDPPLASVGAFQAPAVEAYNQAQNPNINFGITEATNKVVIKGGLDLRQLNKITVGRAPNCEIIVGVDGASRQHCQITRRGDSLFIHDLGSTNGTYLNGQKITQEVPLNNGDVVLIANQSFRVVIGDVPVAKAVPPQGQDENAAIEQGDPNPAVAKTFPVGTPGTKINLKYNSDLVTVKAGAFDKSKITFGRHPDNDVKIDLPGASRFHSHIEKKDEHFELKDLDSRNGTNVNGKPIAQTLLNNGDIITITGIDFIVEIS